jgi:FtsP/CotA-like multicopper oxidase with cupredoxin domain
MSRRRNRSCLAVVATLFLGLVALGAAGIAALWFLLPVDTTGEVEFDTELAIPPLAESTVDDQGRRVFELTAQEGTTDLGDDAPATTWGFNGSYLGPTLRAERGEEVLVNVHNTLDEATTVHWHGMHLPAAMDGGPHQMVEPGGSWSPTWTIDQPATTLWYHPHPHGRTTDHVARGLAGMFILDDPAQERLGLPSAYGVDDLPVIVTDPTVRDNGKIQPNADRGGRLLVNGTAGPYAEVQSELVRLRLLNASTMRVYEFGLDDGSPLVQIASDGGLLPEPHRTTGVRLSPGERAEVLVRMEPGETRVLRSVDPDLGQSFLAERFGGGSDRFDVLQLRAADELRAAAPVPDQLAPDNPHHAGQEADATQTRTFRMTGRQINGDSMAMDRVDEVVALGDTEIWEVTNSGDEPHTFHVHDVQFRVLSVDGREPGPELSGLKDTVFLEDDVTYRLLMTVTDFADAEMPYMYHCHLLRHEDQGMMGQFVVVEDPDRARPRLGSGGSAGHQH